MTGCTLRIGTRPSALAAGPDRPGRRAAARRRARRSSWSRSRTPGDRSQRAGRRARRRRVRLGAARRAGRGDGRRRRALLQGPAHRARPAAAAGRGAAPRGPAGRAGGPRRPGARRAARRGPGRHRLAAAPAAQLDALGPGPGGRPDPRQRRHPDRQGRAPASWTPSCVAAAGLRRLGRIDEATELLDPLQMLPAPAQGALAVECRAERRGRRAPSRWPPCWTTSPPGPRSPPSAPCWPRWRPAAAPRSARWPTWSSDLDDDGRAVDRISLRAVLRHRPTVRCCAPPPPETWTTPRSSGGHWPPSCSTWRTPPPIRIPGVTLR